MSANPDAAMPNESAGPQPEARTAVQRKPRFALFIATACGLGYIPAAPGTFGSLLGALIFLFTTRAPYPRGYDFGPQPSLLHLAWIACWMILPVLIILSGLGVWASNRVAKFSGKKDPQFVVIDEVSGQFLTYLLAVTSYDWKYLLLGFILFRIFDIWKPFPARQAESLPGGWGIMADDWVAGIYAAIGLWIARAAGL